MTSKADKISAQIKATWKSCFRFTFAVALIVILVFLLFDLKQQRYQKEYESTVWREVEAVFDHNYYHQEREEDDDGYKYVDYYDWYFTYQGLDGNSYTYVEKKNSHAASEAYSTIIYVDKYDDSHSLEIKDWSYLDFAKKVTVLIVAGFVLGPYVITFIILYICKFIAVLISKRISEK